MWSFRHGCSHYLTDADVNSEIVGETVKKCKLRKKSISRLSLFDL